MSQEHVIDAKVRADTSDFQKGMSDAERELAAGAEAFSKYGSEADKASQQTKGFVETNREFMETIGKDALVMGAGVVAGLGLAANAAISWESAWAGVTKTVDGSPEQMAALEKELRGLATTLPVTHEEIAGVAEAAGQLGVSRENITSFTKTMIDLGETTNLTAEEAATSIAQISNVMGTAGDDVDNFASVLVALGNAGASTEKEILEMTTRLAGAGKLVGASEGEVLALANAMASVGIEAQLGGGVMSRVMQRMYTDVLNGGKGLDALAKTAGVSSKEFASAFENDPVRAVDMMVKGLSRVKDEGGNVMETMDALGIKGTEETSVILRLAGAGELLSDSLGMQAKEWESTSALAAEAAKRYETTESKIKVAWNGIVDAGIDAGAVLLPVIQGVAEAVVGISKAFGDLPQPVQNGVVAVAAITGGALLLGGTLLTTIPKVYDAVKSFQAMQLAAPRTSAALGGLGKAAGIAAAAFVGFEIVKGIHNSMQPAAASLEEFTQALIGLDKNSGSLDGIFADVGAKEFEGEIRDAGDALDKLINQNFNSAIESFGASIGVDNGMAKLADGITKADQALATAVGSGNMEMAAKGFKSVADSAAEHGVSLEKVGERFPEYLDSLRQMASDQGYALGTTSGLTAEQELLKWALGEVPPAMQATKQATEEQAKAAEIAAAQSEEQAKALEAIGLGADGAIVSLDKLVTSMIQSGLISLSAKDAARGFQAAIDALDQSLIDNGKTLDITTDKGRNNQAAFDGIAGAGLRSAEAMAKNGASQPQVQKQLRSTYDALVAAAGKFGITGKAADDMARDVLGIPKDVKIDTAIQNYADSMAKLNGVSEKADAVNGKRVHIGIYTTEYFDSVDRRSRASDLNGDASGTGRPGLASGGEVTGSGPKGVDSELRLLAPGEHVWTDKEVAAVGGHGAMYAMRQQVRTGGAVRAGGGRELQYAAPAPAPVRTSETTSAPLSLDGYTLELNADATMGTFRRIASAAASGAIRAANDDLKRGRAR